MLQLRKPFKALSPDWYILCWRSRETIDHLFLHFPITLGLWHKIFSQAGMDWVQPSSISDMLVISFKCFGNSITGKTFWRIASLSLSLSCGLCGEREMLGFFRTFGRRQRCCGINFIFMFLFGLTVQTFFNPIL